MQVKSIMQQTRRNLRDLSLPVAAAGRPVSRGLSIYLAIWIDAGHIENAPPADFGNIINGEWIETNPAIILNGGGVCLG